MGCGPESGENAGKFDRERGEVVNRQKMVKYTASDVLLWSLDWPVNGNYNRYYDMHRLLCEIPLPANLKQSTFAVEITARLPNWPKKVCYKEWVVDPDTGVGRWWEYCVDEWGLVSFSLNTGHGYCRDVNTGAVIEWTVTDKTWITFKAVIQCEEGDTNIQLYLSNVHVEYTTVQVSSMKVYGSQVYSGTCEPFLWVGDAFLTVGQILRDIGDRMGTVWFVGDVIQGWFNAAAGYFEGARDWFYSLGDWCSQIVQGLQLGDAWTWLLGLWGDFSGAVTAALGDTWTDLQDMYTNFDSWVANALGGTWTDLQDMYTNFSSWVVNALGGTWTDLQDMYTNFNSWVTGALGDTWTWLLDISGDFTSAVTGALGGTWTWLTEFVNDPMSKLSLDLLELVKSGFEWLTQEWFSFIDSTWDTFKGSFTWLMQKFFMLLDESWDTFEDSMKWLVGKTMDMIGDAAEDFATKIGEMIEKVVKKL